MKDIYCPHCGFELMDSEAKHIHDAYAQNVASDPLPATLAAADWEGVMKLAEVYFS